ncbi:MAG: ATP-dependent helicase HrpB [Gammaproteobacteria bacterium]|nr:ATP-dependent helicase HrpB [Gammaproteobacteria bacterium]
MSTAPAQAPLVPAVLAALARHRDAVLQAPPGAGKSTLVPLALLDAPWAHRRRILLLEPRRLAARAVAARMAALRGERLGATVGYRMRFDTRVSHATRLEVVTEGVLARLLQADPALEGVAAVIFDEYHERSLQADLGLALCLDARAQLGAQFRILVMSATLDDARVAALLDDAAVVNLPGRTFPVEIRHLGRGLPLLPGGAESPERAVAAAVRRALAETAGDLLVFLPGAGEIRRVQGMLRGAELPRGTHLVPLYGELSGPEQDAALAPAPAGERRIVLATNIAETSLTIPGVSVIVDAGAVRRARFDPVTGMSRLETLHVSRASAEQRAGRAGRTAAGICYRLWSAGAHLTLPAYTPAQILEADLAPLALELASWGARDALSLRWLDPPPVPMLAQARELLARLGALDADERLTPAGRAMAALPVHPRLAHMLVAARALGAVPLAAELAALLAERDLLRRGAAERDSDVLARLALLRRETTRGDVDHSVLQRLRATAARLERLTGKAERSDPRAAVDRPASGPEADSSEAERAAGLLALAYPDRIGQRRPGEAPRYRLASGRGAAFAVPSGVARAEYIVAVELDDAAREARIDLAVALPRTALDRVLGTRVQTREECGWDARAGAVVARCVREYGALVLEEQPLRDLAGGRVVAAMLAGVRQLGLAALPWDAASRMLLARQGFVRQLGRSDTADWPAADPTLLLATLEQWLAPWLEGVTRAAQLTQLPLRAMLEARLTHAQRRQLDELAPEYCSVPSGARVRIDYQDEGGPSVAVPLQEVFGLVATPRVGGGAVPLVFKLLSPALRPVQVTRDLANFWRNTYAEVRKDLRGRYPKHHWPEDPCDATPVRGAKRRR